MRNNAVLITCILSLCLFVVGCSAGSIRAMGNNQFIINANSAFGIDGANSVFHEKASEACHRGAYDVLNSNHQIYPGSTSMSGSIRCK